MNQQPTSITDLQHLITPDSKWVIRGGRSKPTLSRPTDGSSVLDMRQLRGILEYDPSEYTFTAYAGTPIKEIADTLAENGQYLPFDPLFVENGATLGGTVASNMAGSGRWRYGGIRDFILGIRFVDGQGQLVRSGGKVVKNAAGFDLSKFFVGSLGCYGILVELSFKVFPQPKAYRTLQLTYATLQDSLDAMFRLTTSALETDAIDIVPMTDNVQLLIRIGGLESALSTRLDRLQQFMTTSNKVQDVTLVEDDSAVWQSANDFAWCDDTDMLVKVPIAPRQMSELDKRLIAINAKRRYTVAGNIAWISTEWLSDVETILSDCRLTGLVLRGEIDHPIIGTRYGVALAQRVKKVLDPHKLFPEV